MLEIVLYLIKIDLGIIKMAVNHGHFYYAKNKEGRNKIYEI